MTLLETIFSGLWRGNPLKSVNKQKDRDIWKQEKSEIKVVVLD